MLVIPHTSFEKTKATHEPMITMFLRVDMKFIGLKSLKTEVKWLEK